MPRSRSKYPMHLVQSVLVPRTHKDVHDAKSARVVAERHGAAPGAKLDQEMPNFYSFRMIDPELARPKAYVSFKAPSGVVTRIARLRPEVMRRAVRRLGGGCNLDAPPRARVICDEEFVNEQGDRVVVRLTRAEYVAGRRSTSTIEKLLRRYGRARVSVVALGTTPHRHRARPVARKSTPKPTARVPAGSPVVRSPLELFSINRTHGIAMFTAIDMRKSGSGRVYLRGDAYSFGIFLEPSLQGWRSRGTGRMAVIQSVATGTSRLGRDGTADITWALSGAKGKKLGAGTYEVVGRRLRVSKPLLQVLERLTHGLGAERFLPQLRRILTAKHLVQQPDGTWVITAPRKGKRTRGH